ncbi:MAG: hypothetical protein PHI66_01325 [Candidatus Pacebacteria bacterium]|nr:hypothetical protein [Candidatus Paceibacterota bacterium]
MKRTKRTFIPLILALLFCGTLCSTVSASDVQVPRISELGVLAVENMTYYTSQGDPVSAINASEEKGSFDLNLVNNGLSLVNCTGKYLALVIHTDVKQEYVLFPLVFANQSIDPGESCKISISPLPGDFSGYVLPEGFEDIKSVLDCEHVYLDLYWYDDGNKLLILLDSLELEILS